MGWWWLLSLLAIKLLLLLVPLSSVSGTRSLVSSSPGRYVFSLTHDIIDVVVSRSYLESNFMFAANSSVVEVVLLGFPCCLDNLWRHRISSGWQDESAWNTRARPNASEWIPKGKLRVWSWLPCACGLCSSGLGLPLLLCVCLWHQVP